MDGLLPPARRSDPRRRRWRGRPAGRDAARADAAATWSPGRSSAAPARSAAWAEQPAADRDPRARPGDAGGGPRPDRAAARRPLARDRALRRRSPRLRPYRRARGADRRGGGDRSRRRGAAWAPTSAPCSRSASAATRSTRAATRSGCAGARSAITPFPRHALIRGERARGMLERSFGSIAIEELATSFCSGASELRSGELVRQPLRAAARGSRDAASASRSSRRRRFAAGRCSSTARWSTTCRSRRWPASARARSSPVDVKASFERPPAKNGAGPRASAGDERPPSLGETLTRVLLLGSSNTSESARRHAQVTIKPRGEGVGLLEFHQLDEAREAGRLAARGGARAGLRDAVSESLTESR